MLNNVIHGSPGRRPALLIAHGLYGSARNWGVIARRLSDQRQVIAVDMRNHGLSPHAASHGYEDMAADLAQTVQAHDPPMDVLGHSMGGKAAMVLALMHPDLVRRLIVADIAPVAYDGIDTAPIAAMRAVDPARVASRSQAAGQMQGIPEELKPFLLQSLDLKAGKWRLNLDVLEREMARIRGFPEVSGRFEGDALFLTGEKSDYVRPEHRDRIKALFPRARFARLPGAGHWLHAEKPRDFEAAVRAFLDRPDQPAANRLGR